MTAMNNANRDSAGSIVSRRRLLVAGALGLSALGVAGLAGNALALDATDLGGQRPGWNPADLADAVFAAFQRHRLVALGEFHGLQEHHDALVTLLTDRRLPELVDDVVIEFGNSLYQDLVNRFLSGMPVENSDLRKVWRDTTNSPLATGDEPIYEDFFRVLRAVNWRLPAEKRIRLLLGDTPIDWSKITTTGQVTDLRNERDAFAASLVEREVLDKGRRALICYGSGHVLHGANTTASSPSGSPGGVVSLIERQTGQRVYSVVTLTPLAEDPGGMAKRLAQYSRGAVIATANTWLGAFNAGDAFPAFAPGPSGQPVNPNCGVPLVSLIDAGLYLGQPGDLTMSRPNPAIYLDQAYWTELQRRNLLQGNVIDLNMLRMERSVRFTPQSVPPPLRCP